MPESLPHTHMVQLHLDSRALMRSAYRQKLPKSSNDLGYLVHGQLTALFGDLAPKPFHGRPLEKGIEVLGYTPADAKTLQQRVDDFAEPCASAGLHGLISKPMPTVFPVGRRLGFEVRACPVVRKSSAGHGYKAGAEVDAFLAEVARTESSEKVRRDEVYDQWLKSQFADSAKIRQATLVRFYLTDAFRRTQNQNRRGKRPRRPVALFRGELEVRNSEAFSRLLARGLGRHRAFGFGMLRLRPPTSG